MVSELMKIDAHVHSYISELESSYSEEVDLISEKIKKYSLKIDRLKNSIEISKNGIDQNYKLFSPSVSKDEEQNKVYFQQITEAEKQLEKYRNEYSHANSKLDNIKAIHTYISILESGAYNESSEADSEKKNEISTICVEQVPSQEVLCYEETGIKILETQEIERKRIARDLHDSTVQNLTNLVHKTELCSKLIDMDPIRTKLELETMISNIRTIINDMRNIIYDLRPMSLDDLGLVVTVKRYVKQLMDHNELVIKFNVIKEEIKVLPVINSTLFRIIQESCNNSLKHAKAKNVIINLEYNNDFIYLTIEDDGCGFEVEKKNTDSNGVKSKFGLSIMKERVYLLSGSIDISSSEESGTKIIVKVPSNTYYGGK